MVLSRTALVFTSDVCCFITTPWPPHTDQSRWPLELHLGLHVFFFTRMSKQWCQNYDLSQWVNYIFWSAWLRPCCSCHTGVDNHNAIHHPWYSEQIVMLLHWVKNQHLASSFANRSSRELVYDSSAPNWRLKVSVSTHGMVFHVPLPNRCEPDMCSEWDMICTVCSMASD